SDTESLHRIPGRWRLREAVDPASAHRSDELGRAAHIEVLKVARRVQPAVSDVPASKRLVGSTDGAVADLHALELGQPLLGRRLEVDVALLDEVVRDHKIEGQRV